MKRFQRILSLLLAVFTVLATGVLTSTLAFAEGTTNEAKIGNTEYATLEAAIDAAQDGDTITLLRDVTVGLDNKAVKNSITIDGTDKQYKIVSTKNTYMFHFYQDYTLKNLKIESSHGYRQYNTAGKTNIGTLDNVEWTLGGGLLVNIQGSAGVPQVFNIVNSTITKTAVAGDPMIATYSHQNWAKPGVEDITINVENSTLNQNGGATNGHVGNTSMFFFCCAKTATLNLKGNTVLNYKPMGKVSAAAPMFAYECPTALNLEAGVKLNLLGSTAETDKNSFVYKHGATGSFAVTDAGAEWNATKAVAKSGILMPVMDSYNGESIAAWFLKDGTESVLATGSPFQYEAKSDTVSVHFSTFTYKASDFVMQAGASIRTEAPMGLSFTAVISKSLYEMIDEIGSGVTYEMYLVKKSDLDATKLGGDTYRLNLLGDRDKLKVNRILWSESEDGKSMLMRGCVYSIKDASEEYVMIASLTYMQGEEEITYSTEINEADHVRSLAGVAAAAIKDSAYADNAYLKSLAGKH